MAWIEVQGKRPWTITYMASALSGRQFATPVVVLRRRGGAPMHPVPADVKTVLDIAQTAAFLEQLKLSIYHHDQIDVSARAALQAGLLLHEASRVEVESREHQVDCVVTSLRLGKGCIVTLGVWCSSDQNYAARDATVMLARCRYLTLSYVTRARAHVASALEPFAEGLSAQYSYVEEDRCKVVYEEEQNQLMYDVGEAKQAGYDKTVHRKRMDRKGLAASAERPTRESLAMVAPSAFPPPPSAPTRFATQEVTDGRPQAQHVRPQQHQRRHERDNMNLELATDAIQACRRTAEDVDHIALPVQVEEAAKEDIEVEKDEEVDIDEMFADLETAMKYLGELLARAFGEAPDSTLVSMPVKIVRGGLAAVLALVVVLLVVLPTFFAVLAVRMVKVEVTKDNFVKRAAIIAAESTAKHAARMGRLLLRALPIISVVIVSPPVVVLAVIPNLSTVADQRTCALAYVTIFTGLVTIMQIQGTVRAAVTFSASAAAKSKSQEAAARVIHRWYRKASLVEPPIASRVRKETLRLFPMRCVSYSAFTLYWKTVHHEDPACRSQDLTISVPSFTKPNLPSWHRNLGLYLAFALEAIQLSLFGFQFLLTAPDTNFNLNLPGLDSWLPYLFFSFPDSSMIRPWVAFGGVCLVVLVVSVRIVYEVARYAINIHRVGEEEAQGEFFYSFVGSVLYGHGNPKEVPAWLCTVIHLLCDVLFFTTVSSLGGSMSCFRDVDVTVARTDIQCFSTEHLRGLTACLVAFGLYIPLSIMVAPVLAEANKPPSGEAISVAKPYTMIANAAKVIAIVVTILASYRLYVTVAVGLYLSLFFTVFSSGWSLASDNWTGPSTSRRVNMSKVSTTVGASLVGVVTVVAAAAPSFSTASSTLKSSLVYVIILPVMFLSSVVCPLVIRCVTTA